jgi:hypothetical protein
LEAGSKHPIVPSAWSPKQRPAWRHDGMTVELYEGQETLEVVGEAKYQDASV